MKETDRTAPIEECKTVKNNQGTTNSFNKERVTDKQENRVLHIVDKLSHSSGVATVVINYWKHMEKYKFDFMVNEAPPDDIKYEMEVKGSRLHVMAPLKVNHGIKYIMGINKFFKNNKGYNIVHCHVPNVAVVCLDAAKRGGVSHRILHAHASRGSDIKYKQIASSILLGLGKPKANHYMACSKLAANYLFGTTENVKILNNAIDVSQYAFNQDYRKRLRRKLGIDDKIVIGTIGRMTQQKNQSFLIEVLKKTTSQHVLIIIGNGHLRGTLERIANGRVYFVGEVLNAHEYYSAFDVFALPSLFEGLPIVGIEAQANGLPCLFADTISKEVEVTDMCEFLDIENIELWVNAINNIPPRSKAGLSISQYDISSQHRRLEEYYNCLLLQ